MNAHPHTIRHIGALIGAALVWASLPGRALASPPDGTVAPPIVLKDLSGESVDTSKLAPRTLILIFGELDHDGARQACADVLDTLADPRLASLHAVPILIVAADKPLDQLKAQAQQVVGGRFPAVILSDPKRDAFGAYRILVVPTVVIVDGQGKVVHAMPGFLQRFKDILTESVLVAAGKESAEQFQQAIDPKAQNVPHEAVRADRLVHLGAELTRHGLYEMAEARYAEAMALAPGHIGAKVGLGELMLRLNRPADAEPLFRSVLAAKPDSVDAALGIVDVQIRRGGDDLAKAEASAKSIVEKDPTQARARYLLGRVRERQGDSAGALSEYKRAAELLLDR